MKRLTTVMLIACGFMAGCADANNKSSANSQPMNQAVADSSEMQTERQQWTPQQANDWYAQKWPLIGFNYVPRTAVNQLEMWQAETWDPDTIDEELSWAAEIGLNTARVFLHDILWQQDKEGFLARIEDFLTIAAKHGIGVMFVFFDGVWHPTPKPGPQPEPIPGVHNSQWVQSPGSELLGSPERYEELAPYVQGVISAFREDARVVVWDLFNEPDNPNILAYADIDLPADIKAERSLELLKKTREWALSVNPTQPLIAGVWDGDWSNESKLSPINAYMLTAFDVVSFHSYAGKKTVEEQITALQKFGRPILCTEYMARPQGSTFKDILPLFAAEKIGAYQWGFVNGRSQTIYPWLSWLSPSESEPDPWFHDLLHGDGRPYDPAEIAAIKQVLMSN